MKPLGLKEIINKPYIKVFVQIYLVIMMSVAFSFIVGNADKGIVSAQGVSTCLENDNGALCQEYAGEDCGGECSSSACVPSAREDVSECDPGTCYDSDWGTCSPNSPPQECLDQGGEFFSDPNANLQECRRGCCKIGSFVNYITQRACEKQGEIRTVPVIFDSEKNVAECLGSLYDSLEGACVMTSGAERECRFTSGEMCAQLDGEFYSGFLCTNPVLNLNYAKSSSTACFGEDVYWVDDHGNKENIYYANEDTWNNGRVLTSPPCYLSIDSADNIAGRESCGNCDYALTSTKCGENTATESLPVGDYVCRDLSCEDPHTGETRFNGESWCYYQGALEPSLGSGDLERSSPVPGSRHFLMQCRDGVVYDQSCGDNRLEICTQQIITDTNGAEKSIAECRPNQAQACLNYNSWDDPEAAMETCEEHPDCNVKRVNVPDSQIDFQVCVPKYPKAFKDPVTQDNVCQLASLECEAAKVVRWHRSDIYMNWGCKDPAFLEQMNDVCMSLGDCGADVNYVGKYSQDGITYSGTGAEFREQYLTSLRSLSTRNPDSYIETSSVDDFPSHTEDGSAFIDLFDVQDELDENNIYENSPALRNIDTLSTFAASLSAGSFFGSLEAGAASATRWEGFGPGVFYAAAAALFVNWLIGFVGDGGYGLTQGEAELAVGAAIVGGSLLGSTGAAYYGGWITLAVVVALTLWFGRADLHEYTIEFNCHSWQPPQGGDDCSKCYDDGFGCSKYSCEALGTECEFINEGTSFEECKYNPSDINPPTIDPLYSDDVPSPGYEYVEGDFGYEIRSTSGDGCIPALQLVKIGLALNEPGRCTISLPERAFDQDLALLALNESDFNPEDFGQSFFGFQVNPQDSLDDFIEGGAATENPQNSGNDNFGYRTLELYFGGNSRYLINHTHNIYVPSVRDLGGNEFDPAETKQLDMNVYCEDTGGHKTSAYRIQMCIGTQDRTGIPPIPFYHYPRDGRIKSDAENIPLEVFVGVPSECKWDQNNVGYSEMANSLDCESNPNNYAFIPGIGTGFGCKGDIPIALAEENKTINVKCEDAYYPGTASENYQIKFRRTDALEITSIVPGNEDVLTFGAVPATVEVVVQTKGGADAGKAVCSYLAGNYFDNLDQTGGTTHSKFFNQYSPGDKTAWIKCRDSVGNEIIQDSNFTVFLDKQAPKISRISISGNTLNIETDELAVCKYDSTRCSFPWENGTDMSIGFADSHSTPFIAGKTYYIKCEDKYGTRPGDCSAIVRPDDFGN